MDMRSKWEFEYTAAKLAEAAAIKRDYRKTRLDWWEAKKAEVMAKVKESGIEVHDLRSGNASNDLNYSNSNMGPRVMVRADLQSDLSQCHSKTQHHYAKMIEYDGWQQVLAANPEDRLKLSHDDWLYFFGKQQG